jgi:hypothetical protein
MTRIESIRISTSMMAAPKGFHVESVTLPSVAVKRKGEIKHVSYICFVILNLPLSWSSFTIDAAWCLDFFASM